MGFYTLKQIHARNENIVTIPDNAPDEEIFADRTDPVMYSWSGTG
jgi:hypothetical protein